MVPSLECKFDYNRREDVKKDTHPVNGLACQCDITAQLFSRLFVLESKGHALLVPKLHFDVAFLQLEYLLTHLDRFVAGFSCIQLEIFLLIIGDI